MRSLTRKLINSVDRALRIVDLFTEIKPEWRLTEISNELDLHKSTVHGLLRTLNYHGYITQDSETKKYKLGLRFLEKGTLVQNGLDLRRIANPFLREIALKYGETVHLALLEGNEAIYIDKIEGHSAIGMYSRVGKRAPLYCTAVGKVLAAEKSNDELKKLSDEQTYQIHTHNTISSREEFISAVKKAGEQGFALDNEELELGLLCIAVPIYNNKRHIVASMSISGPSSRIRNQDLDVVIENLKITANNISAKLGYNLSNLS